MIKFNGKRTHCSDCKHLKINPFIHKLIGDCAGMRCELRDEIIGVRTFPDYCSKFESKYCAEPEEAERTNDEENTFEVQVKPYCHQCEDFEPKVLKIHRDGKIFRQYISCENSDKCKRIESYIRRT